MFKRISIRTKLTAVITGVLLITILVTHYMAYTISRQSQEDKYQNNLSLIARNKAIETRMYLDDLSRDMERVANTPGLSGDTTSAEDEAGFDFLMVADDSADESTQEDILMEAPDEEMGDSGMDLMLAPEESTSDDMNAILTGLKTELKVEEIYITKTTGEVLGSTTSGMVNQNFPDPGKVIAGALDGDYVSDLYGKHFYASSSMRNDFGEMQLIIFKLAAEKLNALTNDTTGLGTSGEILLTSLDQKNDLALIISRLRHKPEDSVEVVRNGESHSQSVWRAANGQTGQGYEKDYRNHEVLTSYAAVPDMHWGVVAKMDTNEIYSNIASLKYKYLLSGIFIFFGSLFISFLITGKLTSPLSDLRNNLDLLKKGILPERINHSTNDEFGDMSESVDHLTQSLRNTASFAQEIGEGNFDANYQPMSEDDSLGSALLNMRNNLIEAEKRDKQRNWIVRGVAEIGEILRASEKLEELGDQVISYIVDKIGAVQGAFYVVNDEEGDPVLDLTSSYAYARKKYLKGSFRFAEGLVGQAAAEKDTVLRTEVPEEYMTLTSGILGDQQPTCLLIVPLVAEETVYGALEFAGFRKFTKGEVKFVEELSVIMARTVFNIKVNERTRKLLAESQAMSGELQEKQEILRQNAEEMQATQEELQRSNVRLEEQIEEVNRTQKRMQLLLENASEVISIYDKDGTINYISPSVEPILGYSQNEMIGNNDLEKIHPDSLKAFTHMLEKLQEQKDEQITIQYEYRTKEGEYIWMEATGNNFLENPAIGGLVVNSQNITERKRAELEQRMRSKMQALSENSPDLITRLEQGHISYINPVIEQYTGKDPVDYLNHSIQDIDLNKAIVDSWLKIVEEVKENDDTVNTEMDFPTNYGERIMQVNAIPEYDENDAFESVLVVSHDITERKIIELDIQNKNKKIADSINYAKRIQNAILPDNAVINKLLPDSFILYKPKDVVSGDFPWYVKVGDLIYIAAVDCTGHGVPGALLSLIGYFLLNDIVKSRKISDPGQILDILDDGVTTTLRQDQHDSMTKDGMDIALCKINTKTSEVEFAGAHRSLYVMKKNEMEEIKGNKFAIGGGIYRNQTSFTNTQLQLSKGDSIYFCSDGFPDQFGGPDNRKFGPKRLRQMITELHKKSMKDAYKIFDQKWEEWRGEEKQTDDVLLIGIKF